jgi:hypothetical protein
MHNAGTNDQDVRRREFIPVLLRSGGGLAAHRKRAASRWHDQRAQELNHRNVSNLLQIVAVKWADIRRN